MNHLFTQTLNKAQLTETEKGFHLVANPNTDFICKYKAYVKDTAAFYYTQKTGDFTLKAEIETIGASDYDAVFLMVRETSTRWIKLALELGVDKSYNAVSVITENWSDDANGELIPYNKCWLRITRKGDFWGLHYSLDGNKWRFVRAFGMDLAPTVEVGFGIQSPKGTRCEGNVHFISLTDESVRDFRDGN